MFSYHQITLKKFEEAITIIEDERTLAVIYADVQLISSVFCVFVFDLLNQ